MSQRYKPATLRVLIRRFTPYRWGLHLVWLWVWPLLVFSYKMRQRVNLGGVGLIPLRFEDLKTAIDGAIAESDKTRLFYVNAHILNRAWSDEEARSHLNQAEITYCDGHGVKVVAWLLGETIPPRMTSPDWLTTIGPHWATQRYRIFWLGAQEGVAALAAGKYAQRFSGIQTVGHHHGYFDKDGSESSQVLQQINTAQPDILLVGFGFPLQESWINQNFEAIEARVIITVGSGIDYLAGVKPRGPQLLTDHGLEWLVRLLIEPRRLWKRYLIGLPQLLLRTLHHRLNGPR